MFVIVTRNRPKLIMTVMKTRNYILAYRICSVFDIYVFGLIRKRICAFNLSTHTIFTVLRTLTGYIYILKNDIFQSKKSSECLRHPPISIKLYFLNCIFKIIIFIHSYLLNIKST